MNKTAQQVEYNEFSDFLMKAGWACADITPLSADMGMRQYYRLSQDGKTALLMDMSRAGILETGLKAYVDVAAYLTASGVRMPRVYCHDLETGLAVIEDLGAQSFGDALRAGEPALGVYTQAINVLIDMKQGAVDNTLGLNGYKETLIYDRLSQFVDYYMAASLGREVTQEDHNEFRAVMAEIEDKLPPCPMGFCHADFHLENLMWLGHEDDPYAVIDFQDAFWGFQGYDLLNLLEDARATVPEDIKAVMKARYCEAMDDAERQAFDDWYSLLSCHFHLRVIGLFIKFSQDNGTTEFLAHIPRLQNYVKGNLENPIMAPLKKWLTDKEVSFDIPLDTLLKK